MLVGSAIGSENYFLFLGYTYVKRLNILENYVEINVRLGNWNQDVTKM